MNKKISKTFKINLNIFTTLILIFILISSLETNNYKTISAINTDHMYNIFDHPNFNMFFQYPSKWIKYEHRDDHDQISKNLLFLQDKSMVVSFDIINDEKKQYKLDQNHEFQLEDPIITINKVKLENPSISLYKYIKIQNDNIQNLFSDFELNINKNYSILIDGIEGWKSEYSINLNKYDVNNINTENIRKIMIIWIIVDDIVYEISYIGNKKQYKDNIIEVQKVIESIRFKL